MIPKIIYMCHKDLEYIKIYSQNWKRLNPEWQIKLYDNELCEKFLLEEYSQLYADIFNFIPDGPIKADFWRVCIINKYGGLYVDADIEPLVPLSEYIEKDIDFATCISFNFCQDAHAWKFNPHFIMSDKHNYILQKCINYYVQYYVNKIEYSYVEWSICKFMDIDNVKHKKSHIHYENGKKYQFLYELNGNDCEYNDVIVLHNRYDFYKDHKFIK